MRDFCSGHPVSRVFVAQRVFRRRACCGLTEEWIGAAFAVVGDYGEVERA